MLYRSGMSSTGHKVNFWITLVFLRIAIGIEIAVASSSVQNSTRNRIDKSGRNGITVRERQKAKLGSFTLAKINIRGEG